MFQISSPPFHGEFASPEATEMVEVDGVLTPLYMFPGMASIVSQCPRSGCGAIRTENGFEYWTAFADGYEGYLPMGGHYAGGGTWSRQQNKSKTPPKLKIAKKLGKGELAKKRAIAATGVFDREPVPIFQNILIRIRQE